MAMNQQSLRTILAQIFSLDIDEDSVEQFIVPKQGNWWNPQDYIPNPDKPKTWIAYLMRDAIPRSTAIYLKSTEEEGGPPVALVPNISMRELQFVGDLAEDLAQSVQFWLRSTKVSSLFAEQGAQLLADNLGKYTVSAFHQDGLNDVLAYNVVFGLQWGNSKVSEQDQIVEAFMSGTVEV
jgi:hypothetical protein